MLLLVKVRQRVDVLGLVDVAWRGGEGGIGPDPITTRFSSWAMRSISGSFADADLLLGDQVDDRRSTSTAWSKSSSSVGVP